MRISLIERDERDCQPGYEFYNCGKERFRGCCKDEACKFPGGCPRDNLPLTHPSWLPKPTTTVASVAAPVLASQTVAKSSSSSRGTGTTLFGPGVLSTMTGGAWYSDTNSVSTLTVVSLGPSSIETQVLNTSAPAAEAKDAELSPAARGAIIGTVAAIVFAIIGAYFLCGKQRRKLRSRDDNNSTSGSKAGVEENESNQPTSAPDFRPDDVFSPFRGRYEEPQTRFNRTSGMSPGNQMMNHPVSPESRNSATLQPPPVVVARSATASPEFISRLDAATPELQGPPQQAAIAALASPGLPKVVEIHSRSQKYKPYRPCANSLYPVAETTPSYLTGTLDATNERLDNCVNN